MLTADQIQKIVAAHFGIQVEALSLRNNRPDYVTPRHFAMALVREFTNVKLRNIAGVFGRMDHSTVLHAIVRVQEMRDTEKDKRIHWNALFAQLEALETEEEKYDREARKKTTNKEFRIKYAKR